MAFYIFVGSLGAWKQFPKLVAVLFVGMWIVFLRTDYVSMPFTRIADLTIGSTTVFFFPVRLGSLCMFYLLAGSALALFGPDPAKLAGAAAPLLAIWLVALWNPDRRVYDMVEMTLLPLVVLGVGLMSRYVVQIPRVIGDISYGTYIYHFAVAEWVFAWGPASLHNATGSPAGGGAGRAGRLAVVPLRGETGAGAQIRPRERRGGRYVGGRPGSHHCLTRLFRPSGHSSSSGHTGQCGSVSVHVAAPW